MAWPNARPEVIVDQFDPAQLLPILRGLESVGAEVAAVLDHVLRQWTVRHLGRSADAEGLVELDELVLSGIERLSKQFPGAAALRIRWTAFRDLLESKRLTASSAGQSRASKLAHASGILEMLRV